MKITPVVISREQVNLTIKFLRAAGRNECVLLWLGRREQTSQRVEEVYKPLQEAQFDYFEIPRQGMAELMERLRQNGHYVLSQIHTHPGEAFHSPTDDRWAIVRHTGALSIVLPYFASQSTDRNFIEQAAVFYLDGSNVWRAVKPKQLARRLRITP